MSDFLKRRIQERDGQRQGTQETSAPASSFLQQRIQQRDTQRAESGYRAPTGTHKTMLGMSLEEYKAKLDEALAAWKGTSATTESGLANPKEAQARKTYQTMRKQYKALQQRESEKQQAQAAQQEYEELRGLDLDEYKKLLEEAKAAAQQEKTTQARDQLEGQKGARVYSGQAQQEYAELARKYNLAQQIQYDERGEQALGKLSEEEAAAVDTLAKSKNKGRKTDVAGAGLDDETRRKATRVLTDAGYSTEEIDELENWRARQQNAQKYDAAVEKREELADKGFWGAAAATALSVPETLASGIGVIDAAIQNNENRGTDRPADYKRTAMLPYARATAGRSTISNKLEQNTDAEIFGQNIAAGAYNIGTSMLDSTAVAGLAALGVPPLAATSLLGGSAATSAMVDAKDRGVSDEQAVLTGLAAGVAESLFEEVSLEKLLKLKPAVGTLGQRVRTTLKNVGLQAATEGSEEFFTTMANTVTDNLINGGLSEFQQNLRGYMEQGMSEDEARRRAYLDFAGQLALDFSGGAIAGGLMAGGQTAIQTGQRNAAIAQEYGDIARGAAQERLETDAGDRLAQDVQNRVNSNRRVGGGAIAELVSRNVQAQNAQTQTAIAEAAAQRLTELGETENVETVAQAAAQLTADPTMSAGQRRAAENVLRGSRYGERVLGELTEGMQVGSTESTPAAVQEQSAAPSEEQVRQAVESTQRSRGAQNLTESRGSEERTQSGRRFASEWAGNLPQVLTEEAYVRRLKEVRVNPQATDSRTVTGTAYNKESGKLDVIVRGTDGKVETIPAAKAATTARQERLMDLAADVGEAGPQMFAAIRDGQDVETYARQWKNAYTYGESNIPRAYAMQSDAVKYLTAEQRDIAYEAGKAAYGQKQAQAREKRAGKGSDTPKAKKGTVKLTGAVIGGKRYDGVSKASLTERQRANLKVLVQVAQATGVDIVLYQSRANAHGEYEGQNGAYKDGTLYLDINAGRNRVGDLSEVAVVRTAAHELTHFIQDYNPAAYAEYRDYVVGLLTEEQGMDFDALVEHKQALQNDLSYDEAVDEVVADGSEMLLRDTAAVQRLAEENRGLFQKIRSWLRKWLENIKKAFDGVGAEHAEAKALEKHLEELQKRWDDALVGASRNLQRSKAAEKSAEKTSVRDYGLTEDEEHAIVSYKSGDSYALNGKLATGGKLTAQQKALRDHLDTALEKLPVYRGTVYRHYDFDSFGGYDAMAEFLKIFKKGVSTNLGNYLSASTVHNEERTNGEYTVDMVIQSETGRSLDGFGRNTENEVLLPRTVFLAVDSMEIISPHKIRMMAREVITDETGATADSALSGMRNVRESAQRGENLRQVSGRDSREIQEESGRPSGRDGDTGLPGLREGEGSVSLGGSGVGVNDRSADRSAEGRLKFSLREPVERTKDLVAVHNLTEQNLRDAFYLGGLPMPSIAVVKAAQGHSMYGPISIVFGRESIDPQTDSRNKIYGGDAYTPTAPAVEYPVDYDRMRAVEKHLAGLSEKVAGGVFRNDSALQRAGVDEESSMSAAELADKLARDDSIRAAYLADQGKTLDPVMQKKEFNTFGNDALAKLVQKIGAQELAGIEASMEAGDYQPVREIEDTVRQIIRDSYAEKHSALLNRKPELKEKRLNRFMENNVTVFTVENFVRDAWEYYQDQGATTSEIDRWATSDKLHEAASVEDVKAWLLPQLEGVLGDPGIYNGSERFDRSGNRQSFSQLHWEYTLENIVRAMTETQAERGGQTFSVSAKAMQAVSTEDFQSIDEVKAASGRLGKVDTEQYKADVDAVEKRIEQVTRAVMRENKSHSDNQFEEMQIIGDVMMQAAQGKRTEAAIRRAFSQEGYSISESTAREIREVFRAAAELPTGYFEAKPQRAVRFDEAKAVIVPDDISRTLKEQLESAGVPVAEYRTGDEAQRLQLLNSEESWRFQPREQSVSERQILANALESVAQNEREKSILADYREKAKKMAFYERELAKREQKIADHRSGKAVLEPDQLRRAEVSAQKYAELISQQDERLLRLEKLKPLRDVVTRERDYIAERLRGAAEEKSRYTAEFERQLSEERKRGEERLQQYRKDREERDDIRVERRQIEKLAKRLTTYLEENTDKKHIPEALKKPIGELLQSLDFSSKTKLSSGAATKADLAYIRSMQRIEAVLAAQERWDETGEGSDLITGTLDLPKGFREALTEQIERVQTIMETHQPGERAVTRMNLADLRKLRTMLSTLSNAVTKMNELFANGRFRHVDQAAQDTIFTLREKGQHQSLLPKVESFVRWDNTLPWYAFQRLGEGGQSIFAELQDGWDKLAFNTQKILEFRKELIDDKTARKWDTEVHEVELTDQDSNTVMAKLTTAQLMSLYCLSRRKQALGHLLGGGIRPADIELTAKLKDKVLKKTEKQDTHYHLTDERLGQLLGLLTDEQREIAQKMQKYMTEQGATWGNEITMARWGYRAFTEENYFPLTTDREDRPARADDASEGSLYRLQNISATKPLTQNANNAVMLYSIFDVYADHMADMAKYNAMVLPILDAQKWYNYKEGHKNEAGQVSTWTVQRTLTQVYGRDANRFVIQFLKDLNGVKENGARGEGIAKKMISNYKRAAVAANLRVALLQPTAYVRASAVLDAKYLTRAFGERTSTKEATAEMLERSGIGLWKSMGMFDTDVGRSIRDQIKGKGSAVESLVDKTMVLAEKGDSVTWARLWRACKLEVADKQHLSGEQLLDATAKRFREVIYRTQVIDSTMTRSHMMRSGSTFAAIFTSFMSEPTVSYNLIMTASEKIWEDAKKYGAKMAVKRNWKTAGRAWYAYILSAVASAMVEALADAWRDSGDDKDTQKLLNAFKDNLGSDLNPLNKLPGLRDIFSIFEGYDTNRTDMAAFSNLNKAIAIWKETIQLANGTIDEATDTTYHGNMTIYGKVYKTAQALSQLSGLPVSATMREAQALWNNTVGRWAPGLKQKTYDNEKQRLIQKAGTAMWNGDKDAWQDAYAALEQYMLADGKSKREAESAVYSEMRKAVKDSYLAGELTETEARQKLVDFLGSDAEKAAQQVTSWKNGSDFQKEVGFEYGEMRSAYETGRIQKSDAVRLRQKYGGETQDEAESKVRYWDFCIEYPQYDDISEARANKYYDYCQQAGVGVAAYYKAAQYTAAIVSEKDEDGNNVSGSVKRQYVEYIQSLGLSAAQQKALWQALKNATWSDKGTPWE